MFRPSMGLILPRRRLGSMAVLLSIHQPETAVSELPADLDVEMEPVVVATRMFVPVERMGRMPVRLISCLPISCARVQLLLTQQNRTLL